MSETEEHDRVRVGGSQPLQKGRPLKLLSDEVMKMLNKTLLLAPIFLLVCAINAPKASAAGPEKKGELRAKEVKRMVESFGVGILAHVRLTLRNGKRMEGFIDCATRDYFYLVRTDAEAGATAIVAYRDVAEIEGERSAIDWRDISVRQGTGAKTMLAFIREQIAKGKGEQVHAGGRKY